MLIPLHESSLGQLESPQDPGETRPRPVFGVEEDGVSALAIVDEENNIYSLPGMIYNEQIAAIIGHKTYPEVEAILAYSIPGNISHEDKLELARQELAKLGAYKPETEYFTAAPRFLNT